MNKLLLILSILALLSFTWETDFEKAKNRAKKESKFIFLNFSGSDWNPPCKKLRKGLFSDPSFQKYAEENLVMVNIDFPKDMSHISEEQNKKNEALADKLNRDEELPTTLLLDSEGGILREWKGMISTKTEDFINELKEILPGKMDKISE